MLLESTTLWIVAGFVLLIGEMLTLGFFLLFIAFGCFAAALVASLHAGIATQGLTCALFSVIGVFALRKTIRRKLTASSRVEADRGKEVSIEQSLAPQEQASLFYQGTLWSAVNVDAQALSKGERAIIVGIDGNILLIKKAH